ncbi:MAG: hypothetical protein JO197_07875 [Acidobacteria bacterium]|nr:hypothetical protein [Acidobacteriota bacterium]
MGHLEYWRFYQSSQFLYLGSVREVTDPEWAEKIRTTMKWHARDRVNIDEVPGFLSVVECVYNLTEYFEFAARLAQAEVYTDSVTVSISIKGIKGFMLAADHNRLWKPDFVATQDEFHYSHAYSPADLVSSAAEEALRCTTWLFERFGWLHPNLDVLRSDQQKLLTQKF